MKGYFNSIDEVFRLLNENQIKYIVLRNYEELENENLFIQGHPDIDMLCADSMAVVRLIGAFSCRKVTPEKFGDGTHYYIFVKGKYVSLDLRHLGDDYYCRKWEKALLETRIPHGNFYVPNPENQFYSLIYHAVFQKKTFSDEYKYRLNQMKENMKLPKGYFEMSDFVKVLEQYMTAHAYTFVYPQDSCVPLMKRWHTWSLLDFSLQAFVPHFLFHTKLAFIDLLVKIKHSVQR